MTIAAETIDIEPSVDIAATIALLQQSFDNGYPHDARYLEWFYGRSGKDHALVVRLAVDGEKVGQIVFIPHSLRSGGRQITLGLVVDFFVLPEYRSGPRVIRLLKTALGISERAGFDGIYGVPNLNSSPVAARFLKTVPVRQLAVRVGTAVPITSAPTTMSRHVRDLDDLELSSSIEPYISPTDNARAWDAPALVSRLRDPAVDFAVHMTDDALLMSCRHVHNSVPLTLLCGFLSRDDRPITAQTSRSLIRSACALHRRPLFCYIGVNRCLEKLPGFSLPARFHRSPMTVVMRAFGQTAPIHPDRYEIVDFDIV